MTHCPYVCIVSLIVLISVEFHVQCTKMNDTRLVRSPLIRAVYQRMLDDERHKNDSHQHWYHVDESLLHEDICKKFIQFDQDEETTKFLEKCSDKADWLFTQLGHSLAKSVLAWFMTQTSINGLLQRGSMFIYSENQFRQLLGIDDTWKGKNLLDLGAGDGMVTKQMARYFEKVYTTEVSSTMKWRLQEKGYSVLGIDEWANGDIKYDLIGCLNLLDRCNKPISILHSIKSVLTPDVGRAVVAVVFPFNPYVEEDSKDHKPVENLLIHGRTFEEQVNTIIKNVFEPSGFTVESFSRLPYLCEGDLHQSFYVLDDAVFVLKPNS